MTQETESITTLSPSDQYLHYVGRHGNTLQYFNVVKCYVNKALKAGVPLDEPKHLNASHMTLMMSREKAQCSKNCMRRFLNCYANFCERNDMIIKNPFRIVPPAFVEPLDPGVISPDTAANILDDVVENFPECLAGVAILMFAGVRKSEITRLRWSAVNREAGFIMMSSSITKTRRRRVIEITPNLDKILEYAPRVPDSCVDGDDFVMSESRLTSLRYLFRRHDVPKNGLRHTFASSKLALTRDAMKVSEEMGNSPQVVHAHYSGLYTPNQAALYYGTFPNSLRAYRPHQPAANAKHKTQP
jgi:integrase